MPARWPTKLACGMTTLVKIRAPQGYRCAGTEKPITAKDALDPARHNTSLSHGTARSKIGFLQ